MLSAETDFIAVERQRILTEYERRERSIAPDLYAVWQPANQLMLAERIRVAAELLTQVNAFPHAETNCLEVGCGSLGWLAQLISWGAIESNLHAIELDQKRAERARAALPKANIVVGDATELPWPTASFQLVVVSTVFSSILNRGVRDLVAADILRVLAPGGALLWYDFAFNNPKNTNVRGLKKRELLQLFPGLKGPVKKVTLAPPLARLIAPRSWMLATLLERVPFLRTHLVGALVK